MNMRKWLIAIVPLIAMGLAAPALALTDEEREARRAEWEAMTPEERQAAKEERKAALKERRSSQREKWENMTDDERTAAKEARRARFEESGGERPRGQRRPRKHRDGGRGSE
jgi:hypothetical protein